MDDRDSVPDIASLVRDHHALLYRYAYRLCGSASDAEDLTQQAYLTAHLKLDQLRDPAKAKAWLCMIVRNTFLKGRRGAKGAAVFSLENSPEPTRAIADQPELDAEELQEVLDELPEQFRTPLIFYYFEELSYREIAEHMGIPIGTVMSRLARAKGHLRRRLMDDSNCPKISPKVQGQMNTTGTDPLRPVER
jgi:RNA polymerase sigma-70 factor (ECF subfamily)